MSNPSPTFDRVLELLADRALFGLSADDQKELDKLLSTIPETDAEELDRLAATAHLAIMNHEEPLPSSLKEKLISQGRAMVAPREQESLRLPQQHVSRRETIAWLATAAALLIAAFLAIRTPTPEIGKLNPAELKAKLTESAPQELTRVNWSPGTDDAGKQVRGEVLWNGKRQQGVMSFQGLPANDPHEYQYQLWIFDTAQDEKYPVDGGVFDIPAGAEETLVPIDAKLPIVDPTLFAVTIEKPGGVVVSSRERLPLLAKVD